MLALFIALSLSIAGHALAASPAPCGLLVSPTGTDTPTCGLSAGSECRTINYAMTRADALGLSCVFVRAGTYNEILLLRNGIHVTGGFDAAWVQGTYDMPGFETRVIGGYDPSLHQFLTVRANELTGSSTLTDLVLEGPDASGRFDSPDGNSSCVVYARRMSVVLQHCLLQAGDGAPALVGVGGADASSLLPPATAGRGGSGAEFSVSCDNTSRGPGGAGGVNTCASSPSSRPTGGGAGGAGGTMDTECFPLALNYNAGPGLAGANAAYRSGSLGQGGAGGPATSSTPGRAGGNGIVVNGPSGAGGSGGAFHVGMWFAGTGGSGSTGENGGGGGGGGGAGGDDTGTDAYGAGGGGGGAGGCAALGGGSGGGGGGGSFGVIATQYASVTLNNCTVVRGAGGPGGAGGAGGRGQPAGLGGSGGTPNGTAAAGAGGNGAHGGHGGGGGGGAGGPSYAGVRDAQGVITMTGTAVSGGSGGAGGAGGISAPGAAIEEDDGNDGQAGSPGSVGVILVSGGAEPARAETPAAGQHVQAACMFSCFLDAPGPDERVALAFEGVSPNPVKSGAMVRFGLPEEAQVTLEVFDLVGRRVGTLAAGTFPAGRHAVRWEDTLMGRDRAAAGVYVLRFSALGQTLVRTAIVVP